MPWSENEHGNTRVGRSFLNDYIENQNQQHEKTLDCLFVIAQQKNYQADNLGYHLHDSHQNCRICLVKNRRKYYKTAEHELLHALRWYIYLHTGIRLREIFGVADFDDEVVHANHPDYTEYEYQKDGVWDTIKPRYKQAVTNDLQTEYQSLARKVIYLAQKRVRQLRAKLQSQGGVVIDPNTKAVVARTLWGEARRESERGMTAVACVIRNRKAADGFRNTWKAVCKQPYQFTVWNPETTPNTEETGNYAAMKNVTKQDNAFLQANKIAEAVISGTQQDITNGATHYHAVGADYQPWMDNYKRVARIGRHIFYR